MFQMEEDSNRDGIKKMYPMKIQTRYWYIHRLQKLNLLLVSTKLIEVCDEVFVNSEVGEVVTVGIHRAVYGGEGKCKWGM